MEISDNPPLNIIFLGSTPEAFNQFKSSSLFNVTHYSHLHEVERKLQSTIEIEAIIAEASLQDMDGIHAYDYLKRKNVIADIPFILIDLKDNQELFNKAFRAGIHDYYLSPIEPEKIYRQLHYFQKHPEIFKARQNNISEKSSDVELIMFKSPIAKRLFDLLAAIVLVVLLSPLMLILAILIKIDSKGPSFEVSTRVGSNFNRFNLIRFRTMRSDADEIFSKEDLSKLNMHRTEAIDKCPKCAELPNGQHCSAITYGEDGEIICEHLRYLRKSAQVQQINFEPDPRVTKVGSFLRKNGLDKLPVLFNIIKGDMSFVGNEPLPVYEADTLSIDNKKMGGAGYKRFHAAAGLTGPWQVELRGKRGELSVEERISVEAKYAENNSFWGDIKLIFRTVKVFIQRGDV
jgi:lipopolysaccharide/colanic/teichoic acid biosynthesis glycosyltransferase